jgi:prepilin-type N-terminal cleavage/methylation domain-containing protein
MTGSLASRRGFTLIELMVAVALSTIIVGTAYAALHAASQVVSITRRQALSNAMLRGALLRSYALADGTDADADSSQDIKLGMPLPVDEWDLVPPGWPLLQLHVEAMESHRAPLLYHHHISWSDHQLSTVGAPYGWTAIESRHRPEDSEHSGDVVQPAYTKHAFTIELNDPISGEVLRLGYAVPGVSGEP